MKIQFLSQAVRRVVAFTILAAFLSTSVVSPSYAQAMPWMPEPGTMVALTPSFTPAHLQGMVIHPNEPFKFDFIINKGEQMLSDTEKQAEYTKLIKYFLAAMAVPDVEQWVNLSPYEKDRLTTDTFGKTEMGRDLLAQDYLLKQITASLTDPNSDLGKTFWAQVYEKAQAKFGTTDVPVDVFNKVWIMPDKAEIYEKDNTVYVVNSHLKLMTEKDYLGVEQRGSAITGEHSLTETQDLSSEVIREVVLPVLEKEVNEGKNFAPLRQVYSGMLLATWYKRTLKESVLGKVYADQAKVKGVDQDPATNEKIWQDYVKAFEKGVFNMIKEDVDRLSGETMPRKYFSGGTEGYAKTKFDRAQSMGRVVVASLALVSAQLFDAKADSNLVNQVVAAQLAGAQIGQMIGPVVNAGQVNRDALTQENTKLVQAIVDAQLAGTEVGQAVGPAVRAAQESLVKSLVEAQLAGTQTGQMIGPVVSAAQLNPNALTREKTNLVQAIVDAQLAGAEVGQAVGPAVRAVQEARVKSLVDAQLASAQVGQMVGPAVTSSMMDRRGLAGYSVYTEYQKRAVSPFSMLGDGQSSGVNGLWNGTYAILPGKEKKIEEVLVDPAYVFRKGNKGVYTNGAATVTIDGGKVTFSGITEKLYNALHGFDKAEAVAPVKMARNEAESDEALFARAGRMLKEQGPQGAGLEVVVATGALEDEVFGAEVVYDNVFDAQGQELAGASQAFWARVGRLDAAQTAVYKPGRGTILSFIGNVFKQNKGFRETFLIKVNDRLMIVRPGDTAVNVFRLYQRMILEGVLQAEVRGMVDYPYILNQVLSAEKSIAAFFRAGKARQLSEPTVLLYKDVRMVFIPRKMNAKELVSRYNALAHVRKDRILRPNEGESIKHFFWRLKEERASLVRTRSAVRVAEVGGIRITLKSADNYMSFADQYLALQKASVWNNSFPDAAQDAAKEVAALTSDEMAAATAYLKDNFPGEIFTNQDVLSALEEVRAKYDAPDRARPFGSDDDAAQETVGEMDVNGQSLDEVMVNLVHTAPMMLLSFRGQLHYILEYLQKMPNRLERDLQSDLKGVPSMSFMNHRIYNIKSEESARQLLYLLKAGVALKGDKFWEFVNYVDGFHLSQVGRAGTLVLEQQVGMTMDDVRRDALKMLSLLGPGGVVKVVSKWTGSIVGFDAKYEDYYEDPEEDILPSIEAKEKFARKYTDVLEAWKKNTKEGQAYVAAVKAEEARLQAYYEGAEQAFAELEKKFARFAKTLAAQVVQSAVAIKAGDHVGQGFSKIMAYVLGSNLTRAEQEQVIDLFVTGLSAKSSYAVAIETLENNTKIDKQVQSAVLKMFRLVDYLGIYSHEWDARWALGVAPFGKVAKGALDAAEVAGLDSIKADVIALLQDIGVSFDREQINRFEASVLGSFIERMRFEQVQALDAMKTWSSRDPNLEAGFQKAIDAFRGIQLRLKAVRAQAKDRAVGEAVINKHMAHRDGGVPLDRASYYLDPGKMASDLYTRGTGVSDFDANWGQRHLMERLSKEGAKAQVLEYAESLLGKDIKEALGNNATPESIASIRSLLAVRLTPQKGDARNTTVDWWHFDVRLKGEQTVKAEQIVKDAITNGNASLEGMDESSKTSVGKLLAGLQELQQDIDAGRLDVRDIGDAYDKGDIVRDFKEVVEAEFPFINASASEGPSQAFLNFKSNINALRQNFDAAQNDFKATKTGIEFDWQGQKNKVSFKDLATRFVNDDRRENRLSDRVTIMSIELSSGQQYGLDKGADDTVRAQIVQEAGAGLSKYLQSWLERNYSYFKGREQVAASMAALLQIKPDWMWTGEEVDRGGNGTGRQIAKVEIQTKLGVDAAQGTDAAEFRKGGIDLNSANLNLQIKRDGNGIVLPLNQQNLENIKIDGLIPVILNISPITTLPMFSQAQAVDGGASV